MNLVRAAAAVASLVVVALTLHTASADTSLGGMDLSLYCRTAGYQAATTSAADAFDWHCVTFTAGLVGMDLTTACRQQYGRNDAYAAYSDFNNPYSWLCYFGSQSSQAQGQGSSSYTVNRTFNPGSTASETLTTIDYLANDQVQVNVVYKNLGSTALIYQCEPGYIINTVFITLGDNTVTQLSDSYCRHHYGETIRVDPGQTESDWAVLKRPPPGRPFTLTFYGRTLTNLTLP